MGRIRPGLGLVITLLVTACGTGNVGGAPAAPGSTPENSAKATSVAQVGTPDADHTARTEVRTRNAWVRLRQDSQWIRPGDRTRLWLDISSSKPVRRYEADWSITQGRLDRWRTDNYWEWNYWTAPEREGSFWLRVWVDLEYTDGTRDREWLSEYLRVNKNRQPE